MRFGLNLGDAPAELSAPAQLDVYLRQVEAGQAAGFRDFFVGHHYAYRAARWFQPFPLLARLSAELEPDSRIGTGILVAPLLSPVALAEDAATLAAMAPGRVVLGLGTGYRQIEYEALGRDWHSRAADLESAVEVMRQLWSGNEVMISGAVIPSGCQLDRELWPRIVVGAKSETGAAIAGRLQVGLLAASKQPLERLEAVASAHRGAWSAPDRVPPMLLMRNLSLAADRQEAAEQLRARSGLRMQSYEREGLQLGATSLFGESNDLCQTALLGPPEAIRGELASLHARTGMESVLLRAQWPGMEPDDVVRWLTEVGRAVIDGESEVTVPDLDKEEAG